MFTNSEYERCSIAINEFKNGKFKSLDEACWAIQANFQLANIMLGNEDVLKDEIVDDSTRLNRINVCNSCNQNENQYCNQCACPVIFITNLKFKSCPLEKW